MKLAYAFIAENAESMANGRLRIAGADFDAFDVTDVPASATLALVAKFLFEREESGWHRFSLDMTRPNGERKSLMEPPQAVDVVCGEKSDGDVRMVLHLSVKFNSPGKHIFHLIFDGRDMAEIPFDIHQVKPESMGKHHIHASQQFAIEVVNDDSATSDDESQSWDELDASAMSPRQLQEIAEFVRSTGQASA